MAAKSRFRQIGPVGLVLAVVVSLVYPNSGDIAGAQAPSFNPDGSLVYMKQAANERGDLWMAPQSCQQGPPDSQGILRIDDRLPCESQLTFQAADAHPAWSPTGFQIAFSRTEVAGGSDPSIYVLDVPTGAVRQLTDGYGEHPAWSPDGTQIAFSGPEDSIWVVSASGGQPRKIPGVHESEVTSWVYVRSEPAWSPDGSQIAYTREGDLRLTRGLGASLPGPTPVSFTAMGGFAQVDPPSEDLAPHVYVSSIEAHDDETAVDMGEAPPYSSSPSWSPDGSRLALTAYRDPHRGFSSAWTVPAPAHVGDAVRLRDSGVDLSWAPDGDVIAGSSGSLVEPSGENRRDTAGPWGSTPSVQCTPRTCIYATVNVVKVADGIGGGPNEFRFTYSGSVTGAIDWVSDPFNPIPQGFTASVSSPEVQITEEESGWILTDIDCGGAETAVDLDGRTVAVRVNRGQSVTCTFASLWGGGPPPPDEDPDEDPDQDEECRAFSIDATGSYTGTFSPVGKVSAFGLVCQSEASSSLRDVQASVSDVTEATLKALTGVFFDLEPSGNGHVDMFGESAAEVGFQWDLCVLPLPGLGTLANAAFAKLLALIGKYGHPALIDKAADLWAKLWAEAFRKANEVATAAFNAPVIWPDITRHVNAYKTEVRNRIATSAEQGSDEAISSLPICISLPVWSPSISIGADGDRVTYAYSESGILLSGEVTFISNAVAR